MRVMVVLVARPHVAEFGRTLYVRQQTNNNNNNIYIYTKEKKEEETIGQ